ncbi:MAG: response regulator transcription factor [Chloroflexota bacterium]
MKPRVLIVDDEDTIRYFLRLELEDQNYEVWDAESGEKALQLIESHSFDVALLDLRLSTNIGGLEIMARLRDKAPQTSVIIITAHATLNSAIDALRQGAHDYVLKPFNTEDLLASIADGVARKGGSLNPFQENAEDLVAGPVRLDLKQWQAYLHDKPLKLTPTELDLLVCFLKNPNVALDSVTLLKTIRGYETSEIEARGIIRVHIHRLRQKLDGVDDQSEIIMTVSGGRYLLKTDA